ncbi:MAG: 4Fe-4S dicluster domain-containing protein [Hyphomicrobiaceae bacterium]
MANKVHRELLVCDCRGTMTIDAALLNKVLHPDAPLRVHHELCRSEIATFETALARGRPLCVACTQEAPLFQELATAADAPDDMLQFVNIRERAGWTDERAQTSPKIAALLACARVDVKPAGLSTLDSNGVCLVYGAGQQALDAAHALASQLSVSVLLTDTGDAVPPDRGDVPIHLGRIKQVRGHLGAFDVVVDRYAAMLPSSRDVLAFAPPQDGVRSTCDLILDLTGDTPLMSEAGRRDGYVRADPRQPLAVAKAVLSLTDLVGTFEKPLYIDFDEWICAHARSGKTGCRRCLDACPMGAIAPGGDTVAIDPFICAGCGNCSSVCPTGAAAYALPRRQDLIRLGQVLLETYREAGGTAPTLLLHDGPHGTPLLAAMARFGRGLPQSVLPLDVGATTAIGHETLAAWLAAGATRIVVLVSPERRDELTGLAQQADLVGHMLAALGHADAHERVTLAVESDPDAVQGLLWEAKPPGALAQRSIATSGSKRETAHLAFAALHERAPLQPAEISLPDGAPYGRLQLDADRCTLCLACVSACPADALSDNPSRPELAFTQTACVQCGICVSTCPERAIRLDPCYDFTQKALEPAVLKSEAPFACISCGKPFGSRSSINRVIERLRGHAMFQGDDKLKLIQMCDNCRVISLARQSDDPFAGGERPPIRTTDDYLDAQTRARAAGLKPEDFLDD